MSRAEWLKKACQRKHLDDASATDLIQALNKAATIPDTPFGPMKVFREFLPRKDAIEYTCYFYEGDTKMRVDYELLTEDLEKMVQESNSGLENVIAEKIYSLIREHQNVREATEAVQ